MNSGYYRRIFGVNNDGKCLPETYEEKHVVPRPETPDSPGASPRRQRAPIAMTLYYPDQASRSYRRIAGAIEPPAGAGLARRGASIRVRNESLKCDDALPYFSARTITSGGSWNRLVLGDGTVQWIRQEPASRSPERRPHRVPRR